MYLPYLPLLTARAAMYFLPLAVLRDRRGKLSNKTLVAAYEIYSQEMINLHAGQGMGFSLIKYCPSLFYLN